MNGILKCIFLSVLMAPLVPHAKDSPDTLRVFWKIGDKWEVETTLYSRDWMLYFGDPLQEKGKNLEKILAQYTVFVQVTAKVSREGVDCWQVDFVPDQKAPAGIREKKYRIWVSAEDGAMKGMSAMEDRNGGNIQVEDVDGIPVLKNAPYGFPLEMIPWKRVQDKGKTKPSSPRRHQLSVERNETAIDGTHELDLAVKEGSDKILSIRQRWGQGANWWNEYEKYNRGHKELQAKLNTE